MNDNFAAVFQQIVPNGSAKLKLVTSETGQETQKSYPTQFPDGSQEFNIATKAYRGIKA